MRPVSCAANAASRSWTNSSAPRPRRSTAAIATTLSLPRVAMAAARCSVPVSNTFVTQSRGPEYILRATKVLI